MRICARRGPVNLNDWAFFHSENEQSTSVECRVFSGFFFIIGTKYRKKTISIFGQEKRFQFSSARNDFHFRSTKTTLIFHPKKRFWFSCRKNGFDFEKNAFDFQPKETLLIFRRVKTISIFPATETSWISKQKTPSA